MCGEILPKRRAERRPGLPPFLGSRENGTRAASAYVGSQSLHQSGAELSQRDFARLSGTVVLVRNFKALAGPDRGDMRGSKAISRRTLPLSSFFESRRRVRSQWNDRLPICKGRITLRRQRNSNLEDIATGSSFPVGRVALPARSIDQRGVRVPRLTDRSRCAAGLSGRPGRGCRGWPSGTHRWLAAGAR